MPTQDILSDELSHTGSEINYYLVCKRKLWLFSHHVDLESDSDLVRQGRLLHEHSYRRKLKEIEIGNIKIDFIEKTNEVHEIKRSKKIADAHKYQLLYYLYFLKKHANINAKGVLNYPLLKKTVRIKLTPKNEKEIQQVIKGAKQVTSQKKPPKAEWKSYCKSCAYAEFCWQ